MLPCFFFRMFLFLSWLPFPLSHLPHPPSPRLATTQHGYYDWWTLGFFIPHVTLNVVSFVLALFKEPIAYGMETDTNPCPERWAPLFSIISFWWMNTLMRLGYKRPLTDDGEPAGARWQCWQGEGVSLEASRGNGHQ